VCVEGDLERVYEVGSGTCGIVLGLKMVTNTGLIDISVQSRKFEHASARRHMTEFTGKLQDLARPTPG
jgi:hypothetical protein